METDFDHLAPARNKQFVSMGFTMHLLQIVPGQLFLLMRDCNVKFSLVLDGIGYLSVADAETVTAKCRDIRKAVSDAEGRVAACPNN